MILSNPPIRAGKDTIFKIYTEAYEHLNKDGEFLLCNTEQNMEPRVPRKNWWKSLETVIQLQLMEDIEFFFRKNRINKNKF